MQIQSAIPGMLQYMKPETLWQNACANPYVCHNVSRPDIQILHQ